jgi:hypothetical protein
MSRPFLAVGLLAACLAAPAAAANFSSDASAGGLLVREGFGARALGMGSAFTAVADDASCLSWNPAGMIRQSGSHLEAGHLDGFAQSAYDQLVYTQNLGFIAVGAGVSNLRGGLMRLDQPDGTVRDVQSENDFLGNLGLGVNITEIITFGLNVKYLQSTLAETDTARSVLTDMGIMLDLHGGYLAGFTLQNFGAGLKFQDAADPLPVTATIGLSHRLQLFPNINAVFAGDLVKSSDQQTVYHFGAEYEFAKIFFLRLGYKLGEDLGGSTAGFGVKWENFAVNYGWATLGSFGGQQKVSLDVAW